MGLFKKDIGQDWEGRRPRRGLGWRPPAAISRRQAENTRSDSCKHKVCGLADCWLCMKCQPHGHDKGRPAGEGSGSAYAQCPDCSAQYRTNQIHRCRK